MQPYFREHFGNPSSRHQYGREARRAVDGAREQVAAALGAKVCDIYTDVDGVYTADPRIVPEARKLRTISYDEMLELASVGSQVMQARSIFVAKKYRVPIHVRSSFHKEAGTMITQAARAMENLLVTGGEAMI